MKNFFPRKIQSPQETNGVVPQKKKKPFWRIVLFFVILVAIAAAVFAVKTGLTLDKVTQGNGSIFKSLVKTLPGLEKTLKGETEGRVNILLLGMRGEGVAGGGLLADTIMVLSIHPKANDTDVSKASLVSLPRDIYVTRPGKSEQRKINAIYALGEERSHGGGGIEDMRTVVSEVTGLDIPYGVTINFQGFKDLVDALGGIEITLEKPFEEGIQFRGLEKRCDGLTYTVSSGNYEEKRVQRANGSYYANPKRYPLCFEKITTQALAELECGGNFKLPAGINNLNGNKTLCYARARYTSSDFDRARRQQEVIKIIKEKALSLGTLTDFSKVSAILESLGKNTSTNLEVWEIKRLLDLYKKAGDAGSINQKVLENSEEGLLYAPTQTKESGYILLPLGNNYDRIHELFRKSLDY